jgi:DNA helicase IV
MPADDHRAPARPELAQEQHHLAESRAALAAMRERTAGMEALSGDRLSGEYLKFTLYKRMKALEDDPEIPLFFGRLDYADHSPDSQGLPGERFYIGRRHVTDPTGEPLVVDWRAPISRPFYRASKVSPMGLRLRRRFGFQHGRLTAYEDEKLIGSPTQVAACDAKSDILEAEIERPRVGPMRDIVATIQPEQDEIVRSELDTSVCVQGAPGTGKTAVGLHRAAYLLYAHRDQLSRQGVLVVGPNDSFLRYIADVLPALGEIDARQTTVEALVAKLPLRSVDSVQVSRIKGDARMAKVLERALWSSIGPAGDALVVPIGSRRWRVPTYLVDEIIAELRSRGVRYGAGRAMLPQRLAHAVLVKMEEAGESPDDRTHAAVARSKPVKQLAAAIWPAVDAERLVMRLLGDAGFLAMAADGVLSAEEQALISWPAPARGPRSAPWSIHDAVLVDEARDLMERTPSLGHVVLDEAQDLSPMMLRAVGRQCSTGSVTVLGDLAQATTPYGVDSWERALASLGKPHAHVEELTLGFRVPGDVIDYATRLLPVIAPTLSKPTSVRRARGELEFVEDVRPVDAAARHVRNLMEGPGSIGVIVPDALVDKANEALTRAAVAHSQLGNTDDIDARVDVVPASLAKGLEFDHVVLVEPADIAASESDAMTGLRRLYVCLTRAVTSLLIVHAKPVPVPAESPQGGQRPENG